MRREANRATLKYEIALGIFILFAIFSMAVVQGQDPSQDPSPEPVPTPPSQDEASFSGSGAGQNDGEEAVTPTGKLVVVPGLVQVGQTTRAVGYHVIPLDLEVEIEYSEHFTPEGEACEGSPGVTPSAVAPTWVTLKVCTAGDAYVRLVDSATSNTIREVSVTVAAAGAFAALGAATDPVVRAMQGSPSVSITGVTTSALTPGGSGDSFSVVVSGLDSSTAYELITVPLNNPNSLAFDQGCTNHAINDSISGVSSDTKAYVVYGCLSTGSQLWSRLLANGVPVEASNIPGPLVTVADSVVRFGSSSYSVTEGSSRSIVVELSHGSGAPTLEMPVTVARNTAESGDYTVTELPLGRLTFTSGDTSESFLITANSDTDSDDETLDLSFGSMPNGVSKGSPSTATVTILEPPPPTPPAPTSLSATAAGPWSVDLSWTSVSGVARHRVERSLSGSGPWTTVSSNVTATTYTVTGLSPNTTYFFRVSAYGDGSTYAAQWSSESGTDSAKTRIPPPPAPTGLNATAAGPLSVDLSWTSVSEVARHRVKRSLSSSGPWTAVSSNVTATTYTATGLSPDTTYFFTVSAYGDGTTYAAEWSSESGTNSAKTPLPVPSTPTGLSSATGDGTIYLGWPDVDYATAYEVEQSSGGGQYSPLPSSPILYPAVTVGGLTNGVSYEHRVRATNSAGESGWAVKRTHLPLLAPTNLSITPMPSREASLSWGAVPGPGSIIYDVQASEGLSGSWSDVPIGTSGTPDTSYEISLDDILQSRGLADATSFDFRVRARLVGAPDFDSDYSEEIMIIDSPITAANGHSPGPDAMDGEAELSWQAIKDVLNDNTYAGGAYSFRYRQADGVHSQLAWRPGTYATDKTVDESELVDGNTIGGSGHSLKKYAIYAIQLIYEKAGKPKVYAARDVYVWPSDRVSSRSKPGETIGGMPVYHDVIPSKTDGVITYSYRICEETLPSVNRSEWVNLINHALKQWEHATNGLVKMKHEVDTNMNSLLCADYTDILDAIVVKVAYLETSGKTSGQIATAVYALLDNFQLYGIRSTRTQLDTTPREEEAVDLLLNEIMMVPDVTSLASNHPKYIPRRAAIFPEINWFISIGTCLNACTRTSVITDTLGNTVRTTDIYLVENIFAHLDLIDLTGGDKIEFNTCPDYPSGRKSADYNRPYSTFVHEAGHALGIGHPDKFTFRDSIVNYIFNEPDCSPHPFDILAIYALYQSVN